MKPAALIQVNSISEKQIAELLDAIEVKQAQVAELTVAVEQLKSEVDVFQRRYNAHIGRYYLELDKVELETKAYRLRLQLPPRASPRGRDRGTCGILFQGKSGAYRGRRGSRCIRTDTLKQEKRPEGEIQTLAKCLPQTRQAIPSRQGCGYRGSGAT